MTAQLDLFDPDPDLTPTLTTCTCGPRAVRACGHCTPCDTCLDCRRCAGRARPSGRMCRCSCNEETTP